MAQLLELTLARPGGGMMPGATVKLEPRFLPGPLLASFVSSPDKTAAGLAALLDAIERLRTGSIAPEDVERAKEGVVASYNRDSGSPQGQITALLDIEEYGLGRDYLINFEARVAAITADEVKAAAQKHLSAQAVAIGVVGPAAALSDPLKTLGQVSVIGRPSF